MSAPGFERCSLCTDKKQQMVWYCMGCENAVCKDHRSADFNDRCLCVECQPKATKA